MVDGISATPAVSNQQCDKQADEQVSNTTSSYNIWLSIVGIGNSRLHPQPVYPVSRWSRTEIACRCSATMTLNGSKSSKCLTPPEELTETAQMQPESARITSRSTWHSEIIGSIIWKPNLCYVNIARPTDHSTSNQPTQRPNNINSAPEI